MSEKILSELIDFVKQISGIETIDTQLNLFKMGLSSIMLTRLKQSIENDFSVEIQMSQFYENTDTLDKLALYIAQEISEGSPAPEHGSAKSPLARSTENLAGIAPPDSPITPAAASHIQISASTAVENIMREQLQAMSSLMARQLDVLKSRPASIPLSEPSKMAKMAGIAETAPLIAPVSVTQTKTSVHEKVDFRSMKLIRDELTPEQDQFIRSFTERYIKKTLKSKAMIQKHRPVFSDWINSLGFRMTLKEIMYPLVCHRSQGARFWDIDGNEYIDMAMGYGVNYFGNNAPFVVGAVEKQLREGFQLGPQFDLTTEVAQLICELTGVDRVTFCNTGSEAVMTALRIARTVTGRDKIVIFQNSYHGTFDGILAIPTARGASPAAPGTPEKMVEDVYVLTYGAPETLEFIQAHGKELAAVLIEPVQSRNPSLQPHDFLKQLREITWQHKIAFIFDEIITGFRIQPGGAQAFYNIQADIVTYGKVIGGGMPIGVIAGKSRFLDAIDGGMWHYGDNSYPAKGVTLFGGTFCKHPLTMTACLAVLKYLKSEGPGLQESVNRLTAYFADTINYYFEKECVPLRVRYCASFFKFDSFGEYDAAIQPVCLDLMFYLMMEKGIYTWERRICFFSTVHTHEDADKVIQAIQNSIKELRANGFPFKNLQVSPQNDDEKKSAIENRQSKFPMSSEQKRLYIINQLEGGEMPYHLPGAAFIDGTPDINRMNEAFRQLIQRHEILRTHFEAINDGSGTKMIQCVHEQVPFNISLIQGSESNIEESAQKFIQPFDLAIPPLMRVGLIQFKPNRYLLLFDIHHLIADGISVNIIVQEFLQLYQGEKLPPAGQYRDYVNWQEEFLRSDKIKRLEAFWRAFPQRIGAADELPALNLGTDYPRPARQTFGGDHIWFAADEQLSASLSAMAQETGTSLFMIMLSAYYVLLNKLSGQEAIIVGIPVAGRNQKAFETTIGMFVNTLPICQHPVGTLPFTEFLNQLKKELLTVYDYQDFPFELIVKNLDLPRNISRNPLFDVMFNFENADDRIFTIEGLRFSPYDFKPKAAMTDLTLEIVQTANRLKMRLEYCAALFKAETVQRFASYYLNILKAIIANPRVLLSEIEILPETEKQQLLWGFNDTRTSYPKHKTISQLFEEQVEKSPNATALILERQTISYGELNVQANKIAYYLRHVGQIKPDEIVGMIFDRSPFMFYAIMGILKAGGAYLPINTAYPRERMAYMLENSNCKILLTEPQYLDAVSLSGLQIIDISGLGQAPGDNLIPLAKNHHLAYLIYTSGSTGMPKGCMLTHENVIRLMINDKFPYDFNASDIWIMAHSYAFDFSVWEMYGAFLYGGKLVVPAFETVRDVSAFLALIKKHRVTVLNQTPPAFYNLINEELQCSEKTLDQHLRWVIFGGDRLEPSHLTGWFKRYAPDQIQLINMYGITETTVHVTFYRLGYHDLDTPEVSPIGAPIPETTVYLLDKYGKPVPCGVAGEIYVGGTGVCRGYLNQPDLTAERFVENPFVSGEKLYKSGDLARRLANGNLEYLGRNDDQIQLRGYRVELGEVEKQLLTHPAVAKAFVMAKKSPDGNMGLVAYLVIQSTHKEALSIAELRRFLNQKLPEYMIPAYFVTLDNFPLTSNGKIDRRALPNPLELGSDIQLGTEYTAPATKTESRCAQIWADILGRTPIGIHDDFFALGGDSIKAIQLTSRINALPNFSFGASNFTSNRKLEVRHIFQYPNIHELCRFMSQTDQMSVSAPRMKDQNRVTGEAPLTAIQTWFFKEHRQNQNHFFQAVLLQAENRLDESALRTTLADMENHHDALRMRYRVQGDAIIQEHDNSVTASLSAVPIEHADIWDKIRQAGADLAESFNISEGPLMKSILFKTDAGDYLLIMIHHLVIDGVSWRILIEDMERAYSQAVANKPIVLSEKTDSFKHWAEKIHGFCVSDILLKEKAYWQALEATPIRPIVRDFEAGNHFYQDDVLLTAKLSKTDTDMLLTRVNQAYRTEINDILLAALARALKQWHGEPENLIMLEGHGRESLFEGIDITRTIGWFTSMYPVLLALPPDDDIGYQIKAIKESLRKIPRKGIGYGLLKYLTNQKLNADMHFNLNPQILFNYLGQFDAQLNSSVFKSMKEFNHNTVPPNFAKAHDFEIEGLILEGCLNFSLSFSPKQYHRDRVQSLLHTFMAEIKAMIAYCSEKAVSEPTPSDFSYQQLSLDALENLLNETGMAANQLKDIYPLSPTQEGLLFHHLYEQNSTAYFEQFSFSVKGAFDIELFKNSWNEINRRYDILRTVFSHKYSDRPLQIVFYERPIEFHIENISYLNPEEQHLRIDEFKRADRRQGFDLSKDSLMRFTIFITGHQTFVVTWSHHHILMDGWCFGILIKEMLEIYQALHKGRKLELAPVIPYRHYIKWLENQDKAAAKRFWAEYLGGYDSPAVLVPPSEPLPNIKGEMQTISILSCEIAESVTALLNKLAADQRVTLSTIFQSLWGVLLSIYNDADDVVFGAAVSGRPADLPGVEHIIGLFLNTVPVRIISQGAQRFADLLKQSQQRYFQAEPFHFISLADIQSVTPFKQNLIDHVLVLENYPLSQELSSLAQNYDLGFSVENIEEFEQTHYGLSIEIYPGKTIAIEFTYNPKDYAEHQIMKINNDFVRLIEAAANQPEISIHNLKALFVSDEEKQEQQEFLDSAMNIDEEF